MKQSNTCIEEHLICQREQIASKQSKTPTCVWTTVCQVRIIRLCLLGWLPSVLAWQYCSVWLELLYLTERDVSFKNYYFAETDPPFGYTVKMNKSDLKNNSFSCTVDNNGQHIIYLCGWLHILATPFTTSVTLEDSNFSEPDLSIQNK